MLLSSHFSLNEFTKSYTATRLGIDNSAPPEVVENLKALCVHVLEPIREHFGVVTVNSGYRCPKLNRAVKGAKNSQHLTGQAADIEVAAGNIGLGGWIEANLEFDQLIMEFCKIDDPTAGWVHVSFCHNGKNRRQVIRIG